MIRGTQDCRLNPYKSAYLLFELLHRFGEQDLEITLRNGNLHKGRIVGFYKSDLISEGLKISKWHFRKNNNRKVSSESAVFERRTDFHINHKDIEEVRFCCSKISLIMGI